MAAPFVYVRTHSLSLPGTQVGGGAALVWCASYDAPNATQTASYRIFKVDSIDASGVPQRGAFLDIASGTITIPVQQGGPYNRDEVGYGQPGVGWPELQVIIPNTTPDLGNVSGLCAVMVSDGAASSWAYFLARRRLGTTKALVCYPFSTLAAYSGGSSPLSESGEAHLNLYSSIGPQRLRRVSLDRPFKNFAFGGAKEALCVQYPLQFQKFLESYKGATTVDVCTSFDLHSDPNVLAGITLFVSVGHDEYWSDEMRNKIQAHVAAGKNAAFFSGNTAWWKVRFEDGNRTMVCFKATIEDPLIASPQSLTGHFADTPGAGLPSSHANREENTLTGVSYRRGILGSSAAGYTVLAPSDAYFVGTGLSYGSTFGPGLLQLEADGAEYNLVPPLTGAPVLTGRDGTPANFKVLASLDLRSNTAVSQRGVATMGYYTNGGTVFTAATTDWAPKLPAGAGFDANVARITQNVIDDLYVAPPARPARPAWTLPARVYPPASWTMLETITGNVSAITSVVQGQLLMQGPTATIARDAESPTTVLAAPTVPFDSAIVSYGSDYLGSAIFGGRTDGKVRGLLYGVYSAQGWDAAAPYPLQPPAGQSGAAVGVAGFNSPFVMLRNGTTTTLYKVYQDGVWRKLGPVYPPIAAITGFDSFLFGVRDGGPARVAGSNQIDALDLYCRDASNLDLTWTKIGTVPPRTYALAAYYGRLYALQAEAAGAATTTTLYWRVALADAAFPYRAPSMLFLNGATFAIGILTTGGDFATTGQGTLDFSYTHVTRANDGLVFFYDRPTVSGVIVRFAADGTFTKVKVYAAGSFGQWDILAFVRCSYGRFATYTDVSPMKEKILFYNTFGASSIGSFDPSTGVYTQDSGSSTALPPNMTHLVCTWAGDLFCYRRSTGACQWGRVDGTNGSYHVTNSGTIGANLDQVVAAGHTYLFFYKDVDITSANPFNAWLDPIHDTLTNVSAVAMLRGRKLASCQNGLVIDYAGTGAKMYGFSADVSAVMGTYVDATTSNGNHGIVIRDYPSGFSAGWQNIVGLGIL